MLNLEEGTIIAAVAGIVGAANSFLALYVRATRAELRTEAETTRREVIEHINSTYVRKEHCAMREEEFRETLRNLRRESGLAD